MSPPEASRRPDPAPKTGGRGSTPAGPAPETRIRKPYRTPRVVSYGRLAELTEFGGSQLVDSGSNLGNLQ